MSINSERKEIAAVVNRLLDSLSAMVSSQTGEAGYALRRQIGDLRAFYSDYLTDGTFAANVLQCFTIAIEGNVKLPNFVKLREQLFAEAPVGNISKAIVQGAIGFCLSSEARIISAMEFENRDDVELMIKVMRIAFDTARDISADSFDSAAYQALTSLAGALTNHLASSALKLPRVVVFKVAQSYPAMALSQRVYYDASRWEELIQENRVIHPAFCPRSIRGLSS
jgi:hypothetical protein